MKPKRNPRHGVLTRGPTSNTNTVSIFGLIYQPGVPPGWEERFLQAIVEAKYLLSARAWSCLPLCPGRRGLLTGWQER